MVPGTWTAPRPAAPPVGTRPPTLSVTRSGAALAATARRPLCCTAEHAYRPPSVGEARGEEGTAAGTAEVTGLVGRAEVGWR